MSFVIRGYDNLDSIAVDPVDPFSGDPIFDEALELLELFRRNNGSSYNNWKTPVKNASNLELTENPYTSNVAVNDANNEIVIHPKWPSISKETINNGGENKKDGKYGAATEHIRESHYGHYLRSAQPSPEVGPKKAQ
ncbi:340_t:CDS:2 [Acaulospora colombiana]|uniref:340_t:CDS:1 n=1 Tax=Acaulospora colombiana TaxID=27376 RepID=A0ACA9K4P0_9GLOM|nr:340_t:CDS:2 [Acaulospora colombiana]